MNTENLTGIGNRNSQHSFAQIPSSNMARSSFDRSFAAKDTINFDELTPILVDEILPGDTMNMSLQTFARLATQVVPIMDNLYLDYFFFFVPCRLVWENWERFNGAQDNPTDSTDYLVPTVTPPTGGFLSESIYDHLGIPPGVEEPINALPLRSINLIWNEWFRDQNLQDSIDVPTGDGPDLASTYTLLKRGKRHDYFTSCLPFPQKGDAVELPLGTTAPVVSTGGVIGVSGNLNTDRAVTWNATEGLTANSPGTGIYWGTATGLETDLSAATAATINSLRQAFMVQSLLELDARGGTRYVEIIKAHFNVVSPDFRLQRPEFLSGGTTTIVQHPVPQTSETNTTAQGTLAAFSTASNQGKNIGFSKSFTEHGYVIGLVQPRADITYQQGLNKMWSRSTKYDFFWPKLQELGEQAVLNKEIYVQGTSADDEVFGYQERYGELRYKPSEIRGQFRSSFAQSLDVWHQAEEFGTLPSLNSTFIESNTPIERALVVADEYPHLLLDMFFQIKHARPMMTYGVPASLGRF